MAIASTLTSLSTKLTHHIFTSPVQSLFLSLTSTLILYIILNEFHRYQSRISSFPGPRGLPLIGNLHQIRKNAAEQYRIWSKTYGDVYQIQLGNVPVLVVNSAMAAKELFAGNKGALSSRPEFYTFHKVCPFITCGWVYLD